MIPLTGRSQNWRPFSVADTLNFRLDTEAVISHTLWIDSVQALPNGDSVFYLNRVMEVVASFRNPASDCLGCQSSAIFEKPQFLGYSMTKTGNDSWRFSGDSTGFVIHSGPGVGNSWLFDSLQGIQVEVSQVFQDSIFSQVDSIKVLSLSNGDTILLSKQYGILQFPDQDGNYYHLEGIENRRLGEHIPRFRDFYDFEPGNKFYFDHMEPGQFGSRQVEILEKMERGDTLQYDIRETGYHLPYVQGPPNYFDHTYTWTFIDSADHPLNLYPGQWAWVHKNDFDPFYGHPPAISKLEITQTINELTGKRLSMLYDPSDTVSTDTVMSLACFEEVYAPSIGRTAWCFLDANSGYLRSGEMVGYIKGADTVGTIIPLSQLINDVDPPVDEWVHVWQEGNRQFRIELKNSKPGHDFQLYDLQGQLHFSAILTQAVERVDLNGLMQGLYVISIRDRKGRLYHRKILLL